MAAPRPRVVFCATCNERIGVRRPDQSAWCDFCRRTVSVLIRRRDGQLDYPPTNS